MNKLGDSFGQVLEKKKHIDSILKVNSAHYLELNVRRDKIPNRGLTKRRDRGNGIISLENDYHNHGDRKMH